MPILTIATADTDDKGFDVLRAGQRVFAQRAERPRNCDIAQERPEWLRSHRFAHCTPHLLIREPANDSAEPKAEIQKKRPIFFFQKKGAVRVVAHREWYEQSQDCRNVKPLSMDGGLIHQKHLQKTIDQLANSGRAYGPHARVDWIVSPPIREGPAKLVQAGCNGPASNTISKIAVRYCLAWNFCCVDPNPLRPIGFRAIDRVASSWRRSSSRFTNITEHFLQSKSLCLEDGVHFLPHYCNMFSIHFQLALFRSSDQFDKLLLIQGL